MGIQVDHENLVDGPRKPAKKAGGHGKVGLETERCVDENHAPAGTDEAGHWLGGDDRGVAKISQGIDGGEKRDNVGQRKVELHVLEGHGHIGDGDGVEGRIRRCENDVNRAGRDRVGLGPAVERTNHGHRHRALNIHGRLCAGRVGDERTRQLRQRRSRCQAEQHPDQEPRRAGRHLSHLRRQRHLLTKARVRHRPLHDCIEWAGREVVGMAGGSDSAG